MRRSILLFLAVILVLGAAAAAWFVKRSHDTPAYALRELAAAVDAKDQLAFEEHFDTKRVAQSVTEDLVSSTISQATRQASSTDGFGALGTMLGTQMLQGMKPMLAARIEQSITAAVRGEDPPPGDDLSTGRVLTNRADFRPLREAFKGLDGVQQRGDVALVRVRMQLPDPDTVVVFTLRMERGPRAWRVVGVEQLGEQLQRLERHQMDDAYVASMKSDLRNLVTAEEAYFADSVRYTSRPSRLMFATTTGVTGPTIVLTTDGWRGWVGSRYTTKTCAIFVGSVPLAPAGKEGYPACQEGPPSITH